MSSSTADAGFKRESLSCGSRSDISGLYPGARFDAGAPVFWHERLDHVVRRNGADQVPGRVHHGEGGEIVVSHEERYVGEISIAMRRAVGQLELVDSAGVIRAEQVDHPNASHVPTV